VSCFKQFTVISGSPGTGKTTTVAKILALLIDLDDGKKLRIALTAPTGKRLRDFRNPSAGQKKR